MHQELPRPLGIVVVLGGRLVRSYVHVLEPDLAVADLGVRVLELHRAGAERLDLRALELDAALPLLEQVVAEARLAVGGDVARLRLALLLLGHAPTTIDPRDRVALRSAPRSRRSGRPAAAGGRTPRPPARCRARSASTSPEGAARAGSLRIPRRRSARTRPSRSGRPPLPRRAGRCGCDRAGTRGRRRRRRAPPASPRAPAPSCGSRPRRARVPAPRRSRCRAPGAGRGGPRCPDSAGWAM